MYLISMMMHTTWMQIWLTFIIFMRSWYTRLRLMQRSSIWNAIILSVIGAVGRRLSIEESVSSPIRRHSVSKGGGSTGSDDSFDFRAWRNTNSCEENKFHVMCGEWVRKPKSSYSTLWVNRAYVSNFDSTASFGSDQKLTLGNIIDGGDVPFPGGGGGLNSITVIVSHCDTIQG